MFLGHRWSNTKMKVLLLQTSFTHTDFKQRHTFLSIGESLPKNIFAQVCWVSPGKISLTCFFHLTSYQLLRNRLKCRLPCLWLCAQDTASLIKTAVGRRDFFHEREIWCTCSTLGDSPSRFWGDFGRRSHTPYVHQPLQQSMAARATGWVTQSKRVISKRSLKRKKKTEKPTASF